MTKFNNSKIYRIVNDVNGMTYYGSSTQSLSKRMAKHRWSFKNNKIPSTYNKFGNIEDCKIFLIENYPCENKEQLLKRERYYIENNECINIEIPGRSKADYQRQYRLYNPDITYKKNLCDCGGKFTQSNRAQHLKTKKHLKYLENKSKP